MKPFKLQNRIALVTGSSSGIGEAIARELARRGARPVLTARRIKELERVRRDILEETGIEPLCIAADIIRKSDRDRIIQTIQERWGELHILVNNAGIAFHGRFDECDFSTFRRVMELNFFSMAEFTLEILPLMKRARGEKALVYISSISGVYGMPGRSAYSASKFAGNGLMESLRIELAGEGFHSLIACPGYVKTDLRSSGVTAVGETLNEKQDSRSISPEKAAQSICNSLIKRKKIAFTDGTGRLVYWLKLLAPNFIERKISKRLQHQYRPGAAE